MIPQLFSPSPMLMSNKCKLQIMLLWTLIRTIPNFKCLPHRYMASQPRRPWLDSSLLCKAQVLQLDRLVPVYLKQPATLWVYSLHYCNMQSLQLILFRFSVLILQHHSFSKAVIWLRKPALLANIMLRKNEKIFTVLNFLFLCRLDNQGSRVWFPVGAGNFSLYHHVQNSSGAHPASYPMGTRESFLWGKAATAWSWPLTTN
jgi:hypothetical protein